MNTLKGKVESIIESDNLSLVKVRIGNILLTSIVIDTIQTAPYLEEGRDIHVIFKETEVIIGKWVSGSGRGSDDFQISLQNRIPGTIKSIVRGSLLSKVILATEIGKVSSIITDNAVNQLNLEIGDEVTAMIKTNEMMLSND